MNKVLRTARRIARLAGFKSERKAKRTQRPAGEATMNETMQPGPLEVRLSDELGQRRAP